MAEVNKEEEDDGQQRQLEDQKESGESCYLMFEKESEQQLSVKLGEQHRPQ